MNRSLSSNMLSKPPSPSLIYLPAILLLALPLSLLPLTTAGALVGGLTLAILATIDPIWGIYAALLSVTIQEHIHLPGGLTVTQATLLLIAGTWSLHVLAHPHRRFTAGRIFPWFLFLLWAFLLSTTFTAYNQLAGIKETLRWGTVLLVYLATVNSLLASPSANNHALFLPQKTRRISPMQWRVAGLVVCLILAPTLNALIGLWQFWTGTGPPSFGIGDGPFLRAYGTIGKPNSFAGYINMGWPLALSITLGAAWHSWQGLSRNTSLSSKRMPPTLSHVLLLIFSATTTLLLLAALIASFSRGGWLGAVGGAGAMLLAWSITQGGTIPQHLRQWSIPVLLASFLFFGLHATNILPAALTQRITSITNNLRLIDVRTVEVTAANFAIIERMSHMQSAWDMVRTHPLVGIGTGNYANAYEATSTFQMTPYAIHPWYTAHGHAHNYYLHIFAESGLAGFVAYLLLIGVSFVQAYATLQKRTRWFYHSIIIGGCGIMGAIAVHNLFENLHVLNMGIQLGAVWGIITALEKAKTKDNQ
jgi:O-antigen ligase